jgi:hypothetical protein
MLLQWLELDWRAPVAHVLAPLIVVALAVPVIVLATLLLVAGWSRPGRGALVAARRFPACSRRKAAAWWQALPGRPRAPPRRCWRWC